MLSEWSPESWRSKPVTQIPEYPDPAALKSALERLHRLPPLVTSWEVENLKSQLAEVTQGKRFLLQGGDCAERLDECDPDIITGKLKVLLQMSLVLSHGSRKRVTRVGRFAGQYAKPRSNDVESRDGASLPSYRGDLVNRPAFNQRDRSPDPERLIQGYNNAALTLNFVRSLIDGGFADLHHPEYWHLDFVQHSDKAASYEKMVADIAESIGFLEVMSGQHMGELSRVEFFTSHEALHLHYEQAQTRHVPRRTGWYNLSTHFPWIGNRTRQLDGAHVEYFRGIENPLGLKVGPDITADELLKLAETLNPQNEPGKLTLIHRFGAGSIEQSLPPLIRAVQREGLQVIWCCDPMHGNTQSTDNGVKTRDFQHIRSELESAYDVHASEGTYLGGVHLELTGENVTECTGGARGLTADDLEKDYRSHVDPRLNYEQALEMAILMAQKMRNGSGS